MIYIVYIVYIGGNKMKLLTIRMSDAEHKRLSDLAHNKRVSMKHFVLMSIFPEEKYFVDSIKKKHVDMVVDVLKPKEELKESESGGSKFTPLGNGRLNLDNF